MQRIFLRWIVPAVVIGHAQNARRRAGEANVRDSAEASRFVTGSDIRVDAGFLLQTE